MLGNLIKRKIDADKFANIFVNSILEVTEKGFDDVKEMILEDNAFVQMPRITDQYSDKFLLIVTVGNLALMEDFFEVDEAVEIRKLIVLKFSKIFDISEREFEDLLSQTRSFISGVNHPSKNMLYGMSKAIFHKFGLNEYQEDYFKSMKTPNPLFLKRMDDLMSNFLWDWDHFFKKHRFTVN